MRRITFVCTAALSLLQAVSLAAVEAPASGHARATRPSIRRHRPFTAKKYLDIPYRTLEGVDPSLLSLDIYAPVKEGEHPVVVMVHGGGWTTGDKRTRAVAEAKSRYFVGEGYVFVSVNYRLSPDVMHPAHVSDVAAALAWIHRNISAYGGDPEALWLMGHSAGGHLAALVALDESYLEEYGESPSIIRGVILLDGVAYDIPLWISSNPSVRNRIETVFGEDESGWLDASPVSHVLAGDPMPPFLVFHTRKSDSTLLADELAERIRKAGGEAVSVKVNKTHQRINADVGRKGDPVTRYIMRFIKSGRLPR